MFAEEVSVGNFVLSEGDPTTGSGILSEHKSTFTEFEILERIDRDHKAEAGPSGHVAGGVGRRAPSDLLFCLRRGRVLGHSQRDH